MIFTPRHALACLLLFATAACEDDDTDTAPSIDNLDLHPTEIAVGAQTELHGTLRFSDPDADVRDLEITLIPPTGASSSVSVAITGADGKMEGDVAFLVLAAAPQAGNYTARMVLHDAAGLASEPSDVQIVAK